MNPAAEFDIIVHGATGFTGRLVAEYLSRTYGGQAEIRWAMSGRDGAKLAAVRDEIGAPADIPLLVADAGDTASLKALAARAKAVLTTVGPYQLYGSPLVAACVEAGTDYLDLCGEPNWMRQMIDTHEVAAKTSGARIVHSAGFDSIPFELGVYFCQETAKARFGSAVPRVKGRVRAMRGGLSGGTAASGRATMEALAREPGLMAMMVSPFGLTPGFQGPDQPRGDKVEHDPDLGSDVGPFMMAPINTKNVHRSNMLMGHPWGTDFVYDEMAVVDPDTPAAFEFPATGGPMPGEGPSQAERDAGFYDLAFIGVDRQGRMVRVGVRGDRDPGYGSTSKIIAEAAICLVKDTPRAPGGVWTPGSLMGGRLIDRLHKRAGLTFEAEA